MRLRPKAAPSVAQQRLAEIGIKPTRRRPAYSWDQKKTVLEKLIELEAPAREVFLRKSGHCPICTCYIGQGVRLHEENCKGPIDY